MRAAAISPASLAPCLALCLAAACGPTRGETKPRILRTDSNEKAAPAPAPKVEAPPRVVVETPPVWTPAPECALHVQVSIGREGERWTFPAVLVNDSDATQTLELREPCPGKATRFAGFPDGFDVHASADPQACGPEPRVRELSLAPGEAQLVDLVRVDEIMRLAPARYEITASLEPLGEAVEICAGPPAVFELRRVPSPGSDCDLERLEFAVAAMRGAPDGRQAQAARALLDACPPERFGPWQLAHLRDLGERPAPEASAPALLGPKQTAELWSRVCDPEKFATLDPKTPADQRGVQAYDACGWASMDLVTREEMALPGAATGTVWAFAPLLEQLGVPAALAKALMRALILGDEATL